MARIRNVKPEFFRHEALQDLESTHPQERPMLVYAGLWTQCSKNGVFRWRPRSLKLDILPFVDFEMENTLAILERHGFIIRFSNDGEEYGYIPKFLDHQAISHKERDADSIYPDYSGQVQDTDQNRSRTVPEPFQNRSDTDPGTADIGHRTNDIGHHDDGRQYAPAAPSPAPQKRFQKPTLTDISEYIAQNNLIVDAETFLNHYEGNGWMVGRVKMKDWQRTINNWDKREKEKRHGGNRQARVYSQTASLDLAEV